MATTGAEVHPTRGEVHPSRGEVHPTRGEVHPTRGEVHPSRRRSAPKPGRVHPSRGEVHPTRVGCTQAGERCTQPRGARARTGAGTGARRRGRNLAPCTRPRPTGSTPRWASWSRSTPSSPCCARAPSPTAPAGENTAEHSWQLALAAAVLAEHADEPVDVARVVAMLLVHDLVEIDAGDTFVYADARRRPPSRRPRPSPPSASSGCCRPTRAPRCAASGRSSSHWPRRSPASPSPSTG